MGANDFKYGTSAGFAKALIQGMGRKPLGTCVFG